MTDFRQALATAIAELTPQPWDYTVPNGTTLTVIPEGMPQGAGDGAVVLRVTASHHEAAEISITTTDMPGLLVALTASVAWQHVSTLDDVLTVASAVDGGVTLAVTQVDWDEVRSESTAAIELPAAQRLPLVSALRRANDVALGWERA